MAALGSPRHWAPGLNNRIIDGLQRNVFSTLHPLPVLQAANEVSSWTAYLSLLNREPSKHEALLAAVASSSFLREC